MTDNRIVGLFEDLEKAGVAVAAVRKAGLSDDDVVLVAHQGKINPQHELPFYMSDWERESKGGLLVGGLAGLLGATIAAGPLGLFGLGAAAIALLGGVGGAATGFVAGLTRGRGQPAADVAPLFDQVSEEGKVLVVASPEDRAIASVRQAFDEHGKVIYAGPSRFAQEYWQGG